MGDADKGLFGVLRDDEVDFLWAKSVYQAEFELDLLVEIDFLRHNQKIDITAAGSIISAGAEEENFGFRVDRMDRLDDCLGMFVA